MFKEKDRGELTFLFSALKAWFIVAAILSVVFSFVIWKTSLESSYIGYISSFISFVSSVAAGYNGISSRKGSKLYTGAFISVFLIIVLLTAGFIIEGTSLTSSGIISVASFSFAGIMMGSNMLPLLFGKNSKKHYSKTRRVP